MLILNQKCLKKRKHFTYQVVRPSILKTDQSPKKESKIKFGLFLKKRKYFMYLRVNFTPVLKKRKNRPWAKF